MKVILVPLGTDGDVFPFVGLGTRLRDHGHRVTLVASARYEALANAHCLPFHPLVSAQEHDELFENPDFWNPYKTASLSSRWGVRFIPRQYELLSKLSTPGTILITCPAVFAAALVHERHQIPLVHVLLQPGLIPSSDSPPVMPGFSFLRGAPRPIWKLFWRGLDLVGDVLVGRGLNRFRSTLGLKPIRRLFHNWLSPQLVLGLFPDWYGPPPPDWPKQIRLTSFPLFDGGLEQDLSPQLLEFCDSGSPPVAFTFGTGMRHSAKLFHAAFDACAESGQRGIFITKHRDQLPEQLPPSIIHGASAPFKKLFPRCAAVVHHGGIGTAAAALAAGIPQLIRPICFDQADNGVRIAELGAADWIPPRRSDGKHLAVALTRLITPETKARCNCLAARLHPSDGLDRAVSLVEHFAATS